MVQFFKSSPDPRDAGYGALAQALGQSLGKGVASHYANKALDEVLNDKDLANKPISARMGKLQSALQPFGEVGKELFQNRMQIEQQQAQEKEQAALGKYAQGKELTEQEYQSIRPEYQQKIGEKRQIKEAGKSVYQALLKAGYPEETAKLWQMQMENAPTGGQSDVIRNVNDLLKRSKGGKGLGGEEKSSNELKPSIEIPGVDLGTMPLDFSEAPEQMQMTPSEQVKQNEYREKINIPAYSESVDRANALDDEFREVQHLQELNEIPDALPSGLEKWNVDWETGDLRVKALATPEAQDYVKTIARMARRAKDFFPGRVTNFDLDQFKQGFPTLANSKEGRRIIAEQLALGNRIAYLKDETYRKAIEYYGSGADPIFVKSQAQKNYKQLKGLLEKQLASVNMRARDKIKQEEEGGKIPIEQAKTLEDLFP